jgi:hypothetical protein
MSKETLLKDLENKIYEDLRQWERRSFKLLRAADFDGPTIASVVLGSLMVEVISGAYYCSMTPEQLHKWLDVAFGEFKKSAKPGSDARTAPPSSQTSSGSKWQFPPEK